ncbi:MAG TPA: family 20 glycosylhydrolase [Sedimentisphaerales bacterium]|nr:family 20 glycosylhydrolase [Sedimentisphaerales bacterium]
MSKHISGLSLLMLVILLSGFCISAENTGETVNTGIDFKIIPLPQIFTSMAGVFYINSETTIGLGNSENADDIFAAQQLIDEIKKDLGYEICIVNDKSFKKTHIIIGVLGRDDGIDDAIKKYSIDIPAKFEDEGYILNISPEQIIIAGKDSAGVFYGVQSLKQIVRSLGSNVTEPVMLTCCRVVDWPQLKYRGWQDDISRGPIPTMDYFKKQIRLMSEFKLNWFTLYTEHVFKLKSHPMLAPDDGITAEQVKEIVEYAKKYHIEVIGNFQSFGHGDKILAHPEYSYLRETSGIFTPAKEETYKFFEDVYSEVAPAYESEYFNINCDETFGLGAGPSKPLVEKFGLAEIYARHINRLYEILKKYDKKVMMWGDIAKDHQEIVPKLPKDMIVLTWGYGPEESFDSYIEPFKKLNLNFVVCPGVNCWNRLWPDMTDAFVNISNFVRDGAKYGTLGVMNTTWDDDGENFFSYNWFPLVWGADVSWNPVKIAVEGKSDKKIRQQRIVEFNKDFDEVFYGNIGNNMADLYWKLNELGSNQYCRYRHSFDGELFWIDTMNVPQVGKYAPDPDKEKKASELIDACDEIIEKLQNAKKLARFNADSFDFMIFATRRIRFLGLSQQACAAMDEEIAGTVHRSSPVFESKINMLVAEVKYLKDEYKRLWNLENRDWWLDKNLAKYDDLMKMLESKKTAIWVTAEDKFFVKSAKVDIKTASRVGRIRYTTDSSEPTLESNVYKEPFELTESAVVKAALFDEDGKLLSQSELEMQKLVPMTADEIGKLEPGLKYNYYEVEKMWSLPDYKGYTPVKTGIVEKFQLGMQQKENDFGVVFEGYLDIQVEGLYTFELDSDDESKFFVSNELMAYRCGWPLQVKVGNMYLETGKYPVKVDYAEAGGLEHIRLYYSGPGIKRQEIPAAVLFHSVQSK